MADNREFKNTYNFTGIADKLRELGYKTVPASFYKNIEVWRSWYQGFVKSFHSYQVYNGQKFVDCTKCTAGMAKKAAENWADLLMNEKVVITLEGKSEQEFWDNFCKANNFSRMANLYEELTFALGTTAQVVRVSGLAVNEDGEQEEAAQELKLDFVMADGVFPLSWENGIVSECAFATNRVVKNNKYIYLQIHEIAEDGTYDIKNYLYENNEGAINEVSIEDVEGFENVPEVFHTHSDKKLFVINTPNIANTIDPTLPMGISVYANAIDQLKNCDNIFDSFNSEFMLGRKRIMVKPEAVKGLNGEQLFDVNDLVFYIMPEDSQNGSTIQEIQSSLRIAEHNTGMQMALNTLSMKCGFGDNHWKFDAGNITTATQVISANSDMFRTIKKHEIILEEVLTELVQIVLRMGNTFMGQSLNEDVEISIDFDDSIIEDEATDFSRDIQLLTAGIINPYEVRMKWLNEDEKTAKENLPKMEDMLEEENPPDEDDEE